MYWGLKLPFLFKKVSKLLSIAISKLKLIPHNNTFKKYVDFFFLPVEDLVVNRIKNIGTLSIFF